MSLLMKPPQSTMLFSLFDFLRMILIFVMVFTYSAVWANKLVTSSLTVLTDGFESNKGVAIAKLYSVGESVLDKSKLQLKSAIKLQTASFEFESLPLGTYAVIVFHDRNNNGETDHNLVGMPIEALGFSSGFKLGLFKGLPSFEKLQFKLTENSHIISIRVKKL